MIVFKAFFRIIKQMKALILLPFGIFMIISFIVGAQLREMASDFVIVKPVITVINKDVDNEIIDSFIAYLEHHTEIKYGFETEYEDALFYQELDYVLIIPEGFIESFLKDSNEVVLEHYIVPDSSSALLVDEYINRYLNTYRAYHHLLPSLEHSEMIDFVSQDLEKSSVIEMIMVDEHYIADRFKGTYFSTSTYVVMMVILAGIANTLMIFNKSEVKIRNISSGCSMRKINFQLFLASFAFATASWLLLSFLNVIVIGKYFFTPKLVYFLLNSYLFMLPVMSASFLIGILIKTATAQSAINNVLSLGLSFISGVFVPQEIISPFILGIAKFFPVYWNVYGNQLIVEADLAKGNLLQILSMPLLIQLGYALALLLVALVISKQKSAKEL